MFTTAFVLAIPTACVAWSISETEVFRDVRQSLARWAESRNAGDCHGWQKWVRCKISYLPTCYYCTAHWIGLLFFVCHPFTLLSEGIRGGIIAYFSQVALAIVYLSAFHVLRVQIRKTKAEADLAEKRKRRRCLPDLCAEVIATVRSRIPRRFGRPRQPATRTPPSSASPNEENWLPAGDSNESSRISPRTLASMPSANLNGCRTIKPDSTGWFRGKPHALVGSSFPC